MKQYTLQELRALSDLSMKDLAEELGISPTAYSTWEKGTVNMPAIGFSLICDYFQLSRDEVKIPHCTQKYSPAKVVNISDENKYLYRKGYNAGVEDMKEKIKEKIKDVIE